MHCSDALRFAVGLTPIGKPAKSRAYRPGQTNRDGGIGTGRVGPAVEAGAHGVAVLGAIWREPDPVAAAKELVQELG